MRNRPENFAGRWAAKEAVSKVLGLGVRGVGWREIEIVRLPTGAPTVRLHGRAATRAEQLGMGRIAVSISHEGEYAVADRLRHPHRRRRIRLPARHRGAPRRPRAADPGAHGALRELDARVAARRLRRRPRRLDAAYAPWLLPRRDPAATRARSARSSASAARSTTPARPCWRGRIRAPGPGWS